MAAGDFFKAAGADVADSGQLIVDGSSGTTGAVEIHSIAHGGDCDVYLEEDSNADGTFETSILLDSFAGEGVSQQNKLEVNSGTGARLRIDNTSGGSADYYVTGIEVSA
jgi:hypothetical protein